MPKGIRGFQKGNTYGKGNKGKKKKYPTNRKLPPPFTKQHREHLSESKIGNTKRMDLSSL